MGHGRADRRQRPCPIGKQIVLRANKSIEEFGPIFAALGLLETADPVQMQANMDGRKDDSPEGREKRAAFQEAIELKNYEFNCHGVELGQRYRSSAVIPDGTPEPEATRDPELYYHPTSWPGARLPYCWLSRPGTAARVSTLDLVGKGRFTILTGIGGEAWESAAAEIAAETGVAIACVTIGPGRELEDVYFDWSRLSEIEESGCLLVRPDTFVAWRRPTVAADCVAELRAVMRQILGLTPA